jgi:hypothetical protein
MTGFVWFWTSGSAPARAAEPCLRSCWPALARRPGRRMWAMERRTSGLVAGGRESSGKPVRTRPDRRPVHAWRQPATTRGGGGAPQRGRRAGQRPQRVEPFAPKHARSGSQHVARQQLPAAARSAGRPRAQRRSDSCARRTALLSAAAEPSNTLNASRPSPRNGRSARQHVARQRPLVGDGCRPRRLGVSVDLMRGRRSRPGRGAGCGHAAARAGWVWVGGQAAGRPAAPRWS